MNIEKQYIELYDQYHSLIDSHASPILNALREKAMSDFRVTGFPSPNDEEYKHTNIPDLFAPDYGLNLNRLEIPVNPYEVFRCDVPNLSTLLYFVVNDSFYTKENPKVKLPEGVLIGSLNEMARSHPDLVQRYYGKQACTQNDGIVALNTAFVQDGFFLYVPKGVIIEKPIQLINILRGDADFMVNRRLLIILEEGAQARLLVCDHTMDKKKFLSSQVTEIYAGKNAVFDYYDIEESSLNTNRITSTFADQAEKSNVLINGITLHNGTTRNNYRMTFSGEHAEAHLCGMAIADKKQSVDNHTFIDHAVPHCTSNELFKYVLNDSSTGSFSGRILVREGAQKTSAYQTNRNLCATKEAHMYTKPQLEIYADDVKCSHGATVGQLDENALFYLRSRGIPEAEARMLLMFAFTNDVIENVRMDALKDRLRQLVEKRFRGELDKCAGCNICQ
ncbi:MAG: Fe-S cluster assembly protein SufD [Tannerella sp.]|uniref:Fe-S cluster assembly protein SufD n=1 Tax=Coprobacter fastidiosus TaxID=1099853 RepID=UPI0026300E23|nr:Fe-S cluster assembly protein SufD [Coprobacter fastidiosus]MBS6268298.1 Fe-S cluster assembly protein SufD [Tannerella sp.]